MNYDLNWFYQNENLQSNKRLTVIKKLEILIIKNQIYILSLILCKSKNSENI